MPIVKRIALAAAKAGLAAHVAVYRRSNGRIGGSIRGGPILILTTTGRKSGARRARPVAYLPDGERFVVCGSNGGSDRSPAWSLNLRNNPAAKVEVKGHSLGVTASEVTGGEYEPLWRTFSTAYPNFATYTAKTDRRLPLFVLSPLAAGA
jgi:deazaflavin-dependent oxidoreductase (nitroreductase family)